MKLVNKGHTLQKFYARSWSNVCRTRPSIKRKFVCYTPTFNPLPKTFFDTSGKYFFYAPLSSENHYFPIMQQWKEKKKKKKYANKYFFPTYLPNQKIQGRGTVNKQFLKDGSVGNRLELHSWAPVLQNWLMINQ